MPRRERFAFAGASAVLVANLNAPPGATQVVFVDVGPADWMLGEKLAGK